MHLPLWNGKSILGFQAGRIGTQCCKLARCRYDISSKTAVLARNIDSELGTKIRYTFRRNTATIIKKHCNR